MRRKFLRVSTAISLCLMFAAMAQPAGAADRLAAHRGSPPTSWVGTWATAPTGPPNGRWADVASEFQDQTLRQIVHTSRAGSRLRVRLSNEFGRGPLVVGEAHVALRAGNGSNIVADSDRKLTFSGRASVRIPAGAPALSDAVALDVPGGSDLAVSIYLPQPTPATTLHAAAFQQNYAAPGNATAAAELPAPTALNQWYFLTGVSVRARQGGRAVVTLGDSITDGANTTQGANHRYPDFLAARLRAAPGLEGVGVLNEGIGGNRLLHEGNTLPGTPIAPLGPLFGVSALARFDRDVLAQAGARSVIVLLGINDIGHPVAGTAPPDEAVSAEDIIDAHRQLIERGHEHGLTMIGATITPFEGDTLNFFTPEGEAKRQAVNEWIRTSGEYDGVVDFDRAIRDPEHPTRMLAAYDSGDHLHPNDAGMAAMANAIPLRLLRSGHAGDGSPRRSKRSPRGHSRHPASTRHAVRGQTRVITSHGHA